MKVIDLGPQPPQGNSLSVLVFQAQKTAADAFGLNQDIKAQDTLTAQLGRGLNNRFTLIRNFRLEDLDIPIPMILIGPTGIFVIHTSTIQGVFQAKNESWLIVSQTKKYEPARPNLITRTTLMTSAIETFLKKKNMNVPDIQGVLYFSKAGIHVDAQRPAVRIVLMDGVDRFIASILQGELHYEREDVQNLVAALTGTGGSEKIEQPPLEEPVDQKKETRGAAPARDPILAKNLDVVSRRLPLTTQQWVLLGIMALVEIIILVTFIIIVLVTA
jgi:hypothetical protein